MNDTAGSRIVRAATLSMALLAFGVAVWLLPASVQIVDWPRSGPQRMAVFAPLYQLSWTALLAAVCSVSVLVWSGRRGTTAKAAWIAAPLTVLWIWTVPYWPWLPDRLPLLLVLAGPLRWLVAALAIAGLAVRWSSGRVRVERWSRAFRRCAVALSRPHPKWLVGAASFTIFLGLGMYSFSASGLSGDEPHYLIITQSLMTDRDLQIENNHARGDYRAYFGGELRPDYLQRGINSQIYSIHAPGLPAMVLPGYALFGARGAVATMCLFAALAAVAIFEAATIVAGCAAAWLTWLAVCFSIPFVPHAWSLYPDTAGAAIVAWAIVWILRSSESSAASWLWRGACLAVLPWLHTKFSVLMAGLVACLLWELRTRRRSAAALLVPIALSLIAWFGFFWVVYGTLDPQAPYGGYAAQFVRLENIPRSLFGLLFDQKFGFLVYAPAYVLCVLGFRVLLHERRLLAWMTLLTAGAYLLSSARLYMWWGGASAPARFMVPVLPLLGPAFALGFAGVKSRAARTTATVAVAIGLGAAAAGVLAPAELLYSPPHGNARMIEAVQAGAPLASALPTFTEEEWRTAALQTLPWLLAVALAGAAAWIACRRRLSPFWVVAVELVIFCFAAAAANPSFSAEARTESAARGAIRMLDEFDPYRRRGYDYEHASKLAEDLWLRRSTVVVERSAGAEPDPRGRLVGGLSLPPGRYELRLWFQGDRTHDGTLEASIAENLVVARSEGSLTNPSVLGLDLPVRAPALSVALTDATSARAARRLEIRAMSLVPAGDRLDASVRVVEAVPDRPNAYVAYVDEGTFPENGVFWTHGTNRGTVLVVPAGAATLVLTLHVGPLATPVTIWMGEARTEVPMAADETRVVRLPLPARASPVPVTIRAAASFRPSEVAASTDSRQLGCQVRIGFE